MPYVASFGLPALASSALGTAAPAAGTGSRRCLCRRRLGRYRWLGNRFITSGLVCRNLEHGQHGLALSSLDSATSHVSKRWRSWHCCKPPIATLVVGATHSACLEALITRQQKQALTSCSRLLGRCNSSCSSQPSGRMRTMCCCSPHMFQAGTMIGQTT